MSVFNKMSNGWQLANSCIKILTNNKQLIIFPILSGLALLLVTVPIWMTFDSAQLSGSIYFLIFLYYIVNYFVVVFFNMALMYCTQAYLDGKAATVLSGLKFSVSRVHYIFLWAVFSATVGVALRILQNNLGSVGKLITAGLGIIWNVATFLVVPILAYENLGPVAAVKRSAQLMSKKWGEGVTANFSLGLVFVLPFIGVIILALAISYYVNDSAGILLLVAGGLSLFIVVNALQSILVNVLYNNITDGANTHFTQEVIDGAFE